MATTDSGKEEKIKLPFRVMGKVVRDKKVKIVIMCDQCIRLEYGIWSFNKKKIELLMGAVENAPAIARQIILEAHGKGWIDEERGSISCADYLKEKYKDLPRGSVALCGLRHREGLSQSKLGEIAEISPCNISNMERGHISIGKNVAKRLAKIFKTDYRIFLYKKNVIESSIAKERGLRHRVFVQ
jgi:plasmid maintenance system antidote protein VapI